MRPPVPVWRRWRRIGRSTLLCGSLAATLATTASPSEASAKKLNEWIQRWLGNPPIASGGTRGPRGGPPPPESCRLPRWLHPDRVRDPVRRDETLVVAVVPERSRCRLVGGDAGRAHSRAPRAAAVPGD
ncbi:MAG: hypothetical protein ACKOOH_07625, partial [Cyanobium sp.]